MEKINFQDLPSTTTPIDSTNLNLLQQNVEDDLGLLENLNTTDKTNLVGAINETNSKIPKIKWKQVEWSGDESGNGVRITTNVNLLNKLVCLEFRAPSNDYHRIPVTFYVAYSTNYLVAQYGGKIAQIVVNTISATGFNLTTSGDVILKLNNIFYLDI